MPTFREYAARMAACMVGVVLSAFFCNIEETGVEETVANAK